MKLPSRSQPVLSEEEVFLKLRSIGQGNLLDHWNRLAAKQKESLARQIANLDISLFRRQQEAILQNQKAPLYTFQPFQAYSLAKDAEDHTLGMQLVEEGKTALLVLAGGQGSRLRCKGPKGCCEVTQIKHKSLYQLLAEKIKAASKRAKRHLEVAVMTSPLNHVETQTFFAQHAFFGLNPSHVTFFYQQMWPMLNFQGDLFLEESDRIARGPNGNGGVFRRLIEWGIWEKWEKMGIEMVNVIPIDNPLAPPFDCELFGFHFRNKNDVTVKSSMRRDTQENVGVLALIDGKAAVIEYSELSGADKEAQDQEGKLKFGIANLGIYCFSLPFIQRAGQQQLPLHLAKKAVRMMDPEEKPSLSEVPNAWKFEEFIFDVLPFADHVQALLFPRESCFAPLKNLKGDDSIETVHAALLAFDRQVFAKITGKAPPPEAVFELAPQFYYPTAELLEKWRGQSLPDKDYIHE
jgi:UDP-N-acetylglucosamine/UDP-N-acetylgalactosamine diphosphorylase